ncbi:hypothetical protein B0T18DRAFT_204174 [Schizothecium vesticola]|uniref:Uncharacterized protein n=1 Tax=Schizothecium vesticola TaxID=314040 RepID=A0AA40JYR4_9PEZI|nr:hypothetical protein B0T18DRAFT_204174 [Schizothecium vesticola]
MVGDTHYLGRYLRLTRLDPLDSSPTQRPLTDILHASKQVQCSNIIPFIPTQHPSRLCNDVYHKSSALASVARSLARSIPIQPQNPPLRVPSYVTPSPEKANAMPNVPSYCRQVESAVVTEPKSKQTTKKNMCIVSDPIQSDPVQSSPVRCRVCVFLV